jgi:hypothetical protein
VLVLAPLLRKIIFIILRAKADPHEGWFGVDKGFCFLHNIHMVKRRIFYEVVVIMFLFVSFQVRGTSIDFRVQPGKVQVGDTVVLTWNVPGAEAVYLTNIGLVSGEGRLEISPADRSSVYTLITEGVSGIETAAVTIEVTGIKGDGFVQREDFKHGRTYEIAAPSLVKLLDCCHAVLRDSFGLEVDERYDRRKAGTVFVTKSSVSAGLVKGDGSRFRARELAYWVDVPDVRSSGGRYICEIRTFSRYRLRKERTWCIERSDGIHREIAEEFWHRLREAVDGRGR